jgi:hypothetical protein
MVPEDKSIFLIHSPTSLALTQMVTELFIASLRLCEPSG